MTRWPDRGLPRCLSEMTGGHGSPVGFPSDVDDARMQGVLRVTAPRLPMDGGFTWAVDKLTVATMTAPAGKRRDGLHLRPVTGRRDV